MTPENSHVIMRIKSKFYKNNSEYYKIKAILLLEFSRKIMWKSHIITSFKCSITRLKKYYYNVVVI